MRLDKYLSHTGFGSRKEVKHLLKKKVVMINGSVMKDAKYQVAESDEVTVSGEKVLYQQYFYYLLNKPKGVISATEDNFHRTVIDLLQQEDYREDIFPVGRLDKDTTGLLLLTNDGQMAHELLSPKKKVAKTYMAEVSGVMSEEDVLTFKEGVTLLSGEVCLPAELSILHVNQEKKTSTIQLTIVEGKFHQVKRMVEAVGKKVTVLERKSMGGLKLDNQLKRGTYRPLTENELTILNNLTQ